MIKKLSVMILAILLSHLSAFSLTEGIQSNASASQVSNPKDEVKLVVSGDGLTEEQAIKTALRSAVEQAYGTFVSANTAILNDALVKDEIVTISTGNIKSYKKIASAQLPNGKTTVTLDAVVCISKLTNYAQSKGASTEFAGALFGMNMKIKELNKKNELKALNNLIEQIRLMLPTAFDMKLYVDDPALPEGGGIGFLERFDPILLCTKYYDAFNWILYFDEADYNKLLDKLYLDSEDNFSVTFNVLFEPNANTKKFFTFIVNNLLSLGLSADEVNEYKKTNIDVYNVEFDFDNEVEKELLSDSSLKYHSRISKKDFLNWMYKLQVIFSDYFSNFQIVDNLGTKSSFNSKAMYEFAYMDKDVWPVGHEDTPRYNNPFIKFGKNSPDKSSSAIQLHSDDVGFKSFGLSSPLIIDNTPFVCYDDYHNKGSFDIDFSNNFFEKVVTEGNGLFRPVIKIEHGHEAGQFEYLYDRFNMGCTIKNDKFTSRFVDKRAYCYWTICCLIPQDKISQYSNFKLVPKH